MGIRAKPNDSIIQKIVFPSFGGGSLISKYGEQLHVQVE